MPLIRARDLQRSRRCIRGIKRLALILVLLAVAPVAHADGCPPSDCGTATVAVPGARTLAVRPAGSRGPAVVYDLARAARLFQLPAGSLSPDGRRHFVSREGRAETTVARYDARRGRQLSTFTLPGRWWLNAVSVDGGRLVFSEIVKGRRTVSRLAVVDGARGTLLRTIRLRGNIEAEAVSRDGKRLFLVQWLRRGYVVRGYDLDARRLTTLRVKGDPALMGGIAWGAVASPDGRWLLTLYLEPDGGAAIHALDLRHGRAACIDVPARSFEEARGYTILVAPGSRTAVAANASTGVAARVDLAASRVTAVSRFEPLATARQLGSPGVVTQTAAYFASERYVWRYDLRTGRVGSRVDVGRRVLGLGLAPGGRHVRAVRIDSRVVDV